MKIFDYCCQSSGEKFERLVNHHDDDVTCRCGSPATKLVSAVRCKLDHISGDFPGETMKWAKQRSKEIQRERKTRDSHGPTNGMLKSEMH